MPSIAPYIKPYFPDDDGQPLAGGLLHTFETGTTTPKATYKYSSGTAHSNPIVLDSRGEIPDDAGLYLDSDIPYRFRLERADATEVWTRDGVTPKIGAAQIAGIAPLTVETVAAMKALTSLVDGALVHRLGYDQAGDGGDDVLVYRATPTGTADDFIYFNQTTGGGQFESLEKNDKDLRQAGCVMDGSTDDAARALVALQSDVYTLRGGGKTCKINSALTTTKSKRLVSWNLDMSGCATSTHGLTFSGSSGSPLSLTSNAAAGTNVITVASTATLAADDYIYVASNAVWSSDIGATFGEWAQIDSVDSGTQITLRSNLELTYNTADSATITKHTLLSGVRLEDVGVIGAKTGTSDHRGVLFDRCYNATVDTTDFRGTDRYAIAYDRCLSGSVINHSARYLRQAGLAYGVAIQNGSSHIKVTHGYGEDLRHYVATGGTSGVCWHITAHHNFVPGANDAGLDAHSSTQYVDYSFNHIVASDVASGSSDGMISQSPSFKAIGNTVVGFQRHGIFHEPVSRAHKPKTEICDNTLEGIAATTGVLVLVDTGATVSSDSVIVDNNTVSGCATQVQVYAKAASIETLSVTGNKSADAATTRCIHLRADTPATIENFVIAHNNLRGGSSETIYLQATAANLIQHGSVGDNTIDGGSIGVSAANTDFIDVQPNRIRNCTTNYSIAGTSSSVEINKTGTTADVGDAAKTLTVSVDPCTQIWNTALTAPRAVTLSTTNAHRGSKFRIVRTANSTGASTLNVGTGPLKALAAGQWCEVEYNGSAWVLVQFGAL